ncbi:MAG: hypothetical protein CK539_04720 [Flavobacteriales bacterium]|nr:MAG: hypothetical protein CK539_04720 [Flavobacteriales bacterium]
MKFKNVFLYVLLPIAVVFYSCQPDEVPVPTDERDVYVGSWTCAETSNSIGLNSFTVHIIKDAVIETNVQIENFYNIGFQYKAKVAISGLNMSLAYQTVNSNQVHGSGTKTGNNSISLLYYVDDGTTVDTCTAVLTRQ